MEKSDVKSTPKVANIHLINHMDKHTPHQWSHSEELYLQVHQYTPLLPLTLPLLLCFSTYATCVDSLVPLAATVWRWCMTAGRRRDWRGCRPQCMRHGSGGATHAPDTSHMINSCTQPHHMINTRTQLYHVINTQIQPCHMIKTHSQDCHSESVIISTTGISTTNIFKSYLMLEF